MKTLRSLPSKLLLAFGFGLLLAGRPARAQQWLLNPGSNDWNTGANWNPAVVPNGTGSTATFDVSNTTAISISASTSVDGITFTANATSPYTITVSPNISLGVVGAGVINNSGVTQNFVLGVDGSGNSGSIAFAFNATAGNMTQYTLDGGSTTGGQGGKMGFYVNATADGATILNNGGAASGASGGNITFNENATAGSATITNYAGTVGGASGGETVFNDSTSGGTATITNSGAAYGSGYGSTVFFNSSTAGGATITNTAGTASGASGGNLTFVQTADAGSATISNQGATVGGANGGETQFEPGTSANGATILNYGGAVSGTTNGQTVFNSSSTAGSATIINYAGTVSGANGGITFFDSSSTAGSATITNSGAAFTSGSISYGSTVFLGSATAGSAAITNTASTVSGATGGQLIFTGTTSAGSATINNQGATVSGGGEGETQFDGGTSVGSATITNFAGTASGANGGLTLLSGVSVGSATIVNNGAAVSGGNGGITQFQAPSTVGSATITTNGGSVSGANGGYTLFAGTTIVGSATIITNGGANGGLGGQTIFSGISDGGTSRAITNGNGIFDISAVGNGGMNIGSIEGSGEYMLGGNTLTVGGNDLSTTLSGVIFGGGGAIVKTGTGTLTLSGPNFYTGGTTISGGALVVNNTTGSGTGSGTVAVNSGGTLGGSGTISNAVTLNSGGFIAPGIASPGVGATLHAASLTWNGGGTTVFQLGGGGDQLALSGAMTEAGTGSYAVNVTGSSVSQVVYTLATFGSTNFGVGDFTLSLPTGFNGTLQETATSLNLLLSAVTSLTLTPGETLVLTYPVTVSSGTITTTGGASSITGGSLTGPNGLTFNVGGNLDLGSTLLGNTVKTGPGSLFLDNNTVYGNMTVLQGLLGGNGTIVGNLSNNGGTVSPGDAPGQIHVTGNYTQSPSGLLQIKIGGQNLPDHDLLSVGGTATLGGTLQLVQLGNFKLQRNEPVTFLTANGGISGRFSMVVDGFTTGTILDPTVIYSSNSVALEAVQGSFEKFAQSAGLTPNEKAVAGGLDQIAFNRKADSLINFLDDRPLSKLPGDFDKISPEALTSVYTIGVALSQVQSDNLQRRTDDLRSGASGFSAANLAINGDGPSFSGGFDITAGVAGPSGDDGKEVKESKEMKEVAPTENRWGAFLSGTGDWVSVGDTNNARGYQIESGGFTLGVDYKVCPNFAIGLAAGYTGTTSDLAQGGRVFVNGGKIGLYGTTFVGGWYADVSVFGGYNSYDSRRAGLQDDARSSADGGEVDAMFGTGYDFKKGALTFGPTATFNYTYLGLNGFSETGSLAPLDVHGGDAESLRTAFGFKASYDWKVGGIVIKPELRAAWQHEYGETAYSLDSSFANGAGGTFTVHGPQLGRDSALLGAGFAIQCSERVSTYFYYDGELGRQNYESNAVTGGVRVAF